MGATTNGWRMINMMMMIDDDDDVLLLFSSSFSPPFLFSNDNNDADIPSIWSFTCAKINLRIRNRNPPVAKATVIGTPT